MSIDCTGMFPYNRYWVQGPSELNEAIDEALGVSQEVENATNEVKTYLEDYIKTIPYSERYKYEGMNIKTLDITRRIFNQDVNFKISIFFFQDWSTLRKNRNLNINQYSYVNRTKTLYLSIVVVGDEIILSTFSPKIAHELRHALQYEKTSKPSLVSLRYYQLTADMDTSLEDDDVPDENYNFRGRIPFLLYLCSQYEQESYAEEMYNELMFSEDISDYAYKKTNPWTIYDNGRRILNRVKRNMSTPRVLQVIKGLGYDPHTFVEAREKDLRNFLKKLGRAIVQAKKDKFMIINR